MTMDLSAAQRYEIERISNFLHKGEILQAHELLKDLSSDTLKTPHGLGLVWQVEQALKIQDVYECLRDIAWNDQRLPLINEYTIDLIVEVIADDAIDAGFCPEGWFDLAVVDLTPGRKSAGVGGMTSKGHPYIYIDPECYVVMNKYKLCREIIGSHDDKQISRGRERLSRVGGGLVYTEYPAFYRDNEIGDYYNSSTEIVTTTGVLVAHEMAHAVQHCHADMAISAMGMDILNDRQRSGHQTLWREIYRRLRRNWLIFAPSLEVDPISMFDPEFLSVEARARLKMRSSMRVEAEMRCDDFY